MGSSPMSSAGRQVGVVQVQPGERRKKEDAPHRARCGRVLPLPRLRALQVCRRRPTLGVAAVPHGRHPQTFTIAAVSTCNKICRRGTERTSLSLRSVLDADDVHDAREIVGENREAISAATLGSAPDLSCTAIWVAHLEHAVVQERNPFLSSARLHV
jgi:hypothetical protein